MYSLNIFTYEAVSIGLCIGQWAESRNKYNYALGGIEGTLMVLVLHISGARSLRHWKEMLVPKIYIMAYFYILYRADLVSFDTLGEVYMEYQIPLTWLF